MLKMHNAQRGGHWWPAPKNTFFSPDDGDGGTPPPAAAEPTGDGAGTGDGATNNLNDEKIYSKAEFEAMFGPRAKRAEETAVKALLSKFKFDSVEAAEEFLNNARQKADAELSEVERLKKQLGEAPTAEAVTELSQRVEAQDKVIAGLVEGLVKDLNIPKHVVALFDSMTPTQQLEYINSNRDAFKPTPAAPNLNGGNKGGGDGKNIKKTVQSKYGIRRRNRS